jgi:hypothetical protein
MIHYMKYMPCRRHGRRSHRIRKDEVEAFLDEFTTFLSRLPHVYEQLRLNQFTQAFTLRQGRNLRGVWGGVTPPKVQLIWIGRASHLDWQGNERF